MTDVTWGEPIEVNGKRPEWFDLSRGPLGYKRAHEKTWFGPGNIWSETDILDGDDTGWSSVTHLILPANHPYYSTIRLPADWALTEAFNRSVFDKSDSYDLNFVRAHSTIYGSYIELARMIEKYEPHLAPVDPDVLAVREILSVVVTYGEAVKHGKFDQDGGFKTALDIFRRVAVARG